LLACVREMTTSKWKVRRFFEGRAMVGKQPN
jgi:hypothetical protein